jgi:hypothetical protein
MPLQLNINPANKKAAFSITDNFRPLMEIPDGLSKPEVQSLVRINHPERAAEILEFIETVSLKIQTFPRL